MGVNGMITAGDSLLQGFSFRQMDYPLGNCQSKQFMMKETFLLSD